MQAVRYTDNSPAAGFGLSCRDFDKGWGGIKLDFTPIQGGDFACPKSCKQTDCNGGEQRSAFAIALAHFEQASALFDRQDGYWFINDVRAFNMDSRIVIAPTALNCPPKECLEVVKMTIARGWTLVSAQMLRNVSW